MGQKAVVTLRIGTLFCLFLMVAVALLPQAARAAAPGELHCDPSIMSEMERRIANDWTRAQQRLTSNFPRPNDLDRMFCSAQITNMFNSINQSLVSSVFGAIKGLVDGLMRQACNMAVAPLQMLANAICIPAFNFSLNYSLPSANTGTCNGTPLFQVTPSYNAYPYQGGGSTVTFPIIP